MRMNPWNYLYGSTKVDKPKATQRNTTVSYDVAEPLNTFQNSLSGVDIIPNQTPLSRVHTIRAFQEMLKSNPERFMSECAITASPFFAKTVQDKITLVKGAGEDSTISIIVTDSEGKVDEEAAKEINRFFEEVQPKRFGGLWGLIIMGVQAVGFFDTGFACEGVVADNMLEGYRAIYPFACRSIFLGKRKDIKTSDYLLLHKRAKHPATEGAFVELDPQHTHFSINAPTIDNPMGRVAIPSAPNATVVEIIAARDLSDAIGQSGNGTNIFKYSSSALMKEALEGLKYTKAKAEQFVKDKIEELKEFARSFKASDNAVIDSSSDLSRKEVGDFTKLDPAIQTLWTRNAASINNTQEMLGFGDTTRDTYAYQQFAGATASERDTVVNVLARAMEMHLRLQGKIRTVKFICPKIHLIEELTFQNTLQMKIRNASMLYALGQFNDADFSEFISGESVGKKIDKDTALLVAGIPSDRNGSKKTTNDPNNNTGGTPGSGSRQGVKNK